MHSQLCIQNKGPGVYLLPARAISTKNKHLLVIYSIPTRGFTAALSVFMGTPPAKPLDCKIRLNTFGAHFSDLWAEPTGGEPRLSCALISLVFNDIIEMSLIYNSQFVHLLVFIVSFFTAVQGNKKPCLLSVSRV